MPLDFDSMLAPDPPALRVRDRAVEPEPTLPESVLRAVPAVCLQMERAGHAGESAAFRSARRRLGDLVRTPRDGYPPEG